MELLRQSWWGKVILADGFCANAAKISCFNVGKSQNLISWYNLVSTSSARSFRGRRTPKFAKIGAANNKVGVEEVEVREAAAPPTE